MYYFSIVFIATYFPVSQCIARVTFPKAPLPTS